MELLSDHLGHRNSPSGQTKNYDLAITLLHQHLGQKSPSF
jgi:hypothetical protein